jgi:hypothetical protein
MNKLNENKLAADLQKWFDDNNLITIHFWERNPVANVIKKQLKQIGKWKYRARGNPRKGYESLQKKKINQDNW